MSKKVEIGRTIFPGSVTVIRVEVGPMESPGSGSFLRLCLVCVEYTQVKPGVTIPVTCA